MRVAVVTVSDSVAQGKREDSSGPSVVESCKKLGWEVASTQVVPDEEAKIRAALERLADGDVADLILTTGGTGIGPRDVTPEATSKVVSKFIPGLSEQIRRKGIDATPRAILSRGVAGIRGKSLIVNLPGSPKGAAESLDAVANLLPHAVNVLHGARHD